jgi:hypothetical protein
LETVIGKSLLSNQKEKISAIDVGSSLARSMDEKPIKSIKFGERLVPKQ